MAEQLIRTAVLLPFQIARRVVGFAAGLVPGVGAGQPETPLHEPDVQDADLDDARRAAAEALERDREPREEAIFTPDDDFFDEDDHVEVELEVVAESADPEATDPPGPQLHVDEPWDGYRRMKVAEIVAQLEGQPAEVLAAVELYETTHRKRRGVLDAARSATRG